MFIQSTKISNLYASTISHIFFSHPLLSVKIWTSPSIMDMCVKSVNFFFFHIPLSWLCSLTLLD